MAPEPSLPAIKALGRPYRDRTFSTALAIASVVTPKKSEPALTTSSVHGPKRPSLGVGGWIAILALGVLLGAAIWFLFYGWNLSGGQIDTNGYIALGLGVFLSMVLGGGLMALLFWSNRKGYDR